MIILNDKNYHTWKTQLLRFSDDHKSRGILEGDISESNAASLEGLTISSFTDDRNLPSEEELAFSEFSILPGSFLTEPEKDLKKRQLEFSLNNKRQSEYYRRLLKLSAHLRDSISEDLQSEILHLSKPHEIFKHIASRYEGDDLLTSHRHLTNLVGMKFTYGGDLVKFFAEMKAAWTTVLESDSYRLMPPRVLVGTILNAMPKEMSTSVENAQGQCSESDMPQKLMDEIVKRYISHHHDARVSQASAFPAVAPSPTKCSFCLQRGVKTVNHTFTECRSRHALLHPDSTSPETPEVLGFTAGTPCDPESAIFDSGASLHISGRRDLFVDFNAIPPINISAVSGPGTQATGIGKVRFQYVVGQSIKTMELHDAYFVKNSPTTLISLSRLRQANFSFHYPASSDYGLLLTSSLRPLLRIPIKDGVFKIQICTSHAHAAAYLAHPRATNSDLNTWHSRYCHLNETDLRHVLKRTEGITFPRHLTVRCDPCRLAKGTQLPYDGHHNHASAPLELIHSDVCGPIDSNTSQKQRWFITFIDEYTRFAHVYTLESKSDAFEAWCRFYNSVTNLTDFRPKYFRCDRGTEFVNHYFQRFFQDHGMKYQLTTPYSPPSNGLAERYNRTLLENTTTLLSDANLNRRHWPYAIAYVNYVRNCSPHRALKRLTPYERFFNTMPRPHRLHPFGCRVIFHNARDHHAKLDTRMSTGLFLGYPSDSNGAYILVDGQQDVVYLARSFRFDDDNLPGPKRVAHVQRYVDRDFITDHIPRPVPAPITNLGPQDTATSHVLPADGPEETPAHQPPAIEPEEPSGDKTPASHPPEENPPNVTPAPQPEEELPAQALASQQSQATSPAEDSLMADSILDKSTSPRHDANSVAEDSRHTTSASSSSPAAAPVVSASVGSTAAPSATCPAAPATGPSTDSRSLKRKTSPTTAAAPDKKIIIPGEARQQALQEARSIRLPREDVHHAYHASPVPSVNPVEPNTIKQALKSPDAHHWLAASQEELSTHSKNNTWSIVNASEVPKDRRLVGCRWVYRRKYNASNEPTTYKARLVAQGFTQEPGRDFDQASSPVTSLTTIRFLTALAVNEGFHVHQMDVKAAYLNGELKETIYMKLPPGFENNYPPESICKLNKSLYGLKQAGKVWYDKLAHTLNESGFTATHVEPCLFYSKENDAIVNVYVDDLLILSKDLKTIEDIKNLLSSKFEMKDLGVSNHILGMRINYNRDIGFAQIDLSGYIERCLTDLNLTNVVQYKMPIDPSETYSIKDADLDSPKDRADMANKPYASAVGKLNWIAYAARPDIAYAVNVCGRFSSKPSIRHWNLVRRIFGYLRRTMNHSITYARSGIRINGFTQGALQHNILEGWTDADLGGCPDTRRSMSGFVFTAAGGAISWKAKRQRCASTSTAEAEYVAIEQGGREAMWLRQLCGAISRPMNDSIQMFCDNSAAVQIVHNDSISTDFRHIDIKYHAIKDHQSQGKLNIKKIEGRNQLADLFTKGLQGDRLKSLCHQIGLQSIQSVSPQLVESEEC